MGLGCPWSGLCGVLSCRPGRSLHLLTASPLIGPFIGPFTCAVPWHEQQLEASINELNDDDVADQVGTVLPHNGARASSFGRPRPARSPPTACSRRAAHQEHGPEHLQELHRGKEGLQFHM